MSGFTSGMKSSASNEWSTPRWLFDELDSEFHFTLDAASTHENALCERHYTAEDDALGKSWDGEIVWLNPPYGRAIGEFMRKASEISGGGCCVCLVPARTETKWFKDHVVGKASEIRFLHGRLKFGDGKNSAPFPSCIVVFDDRPKKWWVVHG
jgi:site-specific DNA-methyltransferase (adenine-specific)